MVDRRTGASLAEQIKQLAVPPGHLAIWALGQHGFVFRGGGTTVLIDPYLSTNGDDPPGTLPRQVPIVIDPPALDMIDVVLVTHHHLDHCDAHTLGPVLQASPRARFLTSYKARDELVQQGIDAGRIEVASIDRAIGLGPQLEITPIPAAHYTEERDADGNPGYLGFIIQLNGVTIYHSGDSIVYPGQLERLRRQPIDMACLPINGRDWFREQANVVGNMDYREAAELAAAAGIDVLIPAHNDMFRSNRINPAYLVDYLASNHPGQRFHFLQAGELYYYVK